MTAPLLSMRPIVIVRLDTGRARTIEPLERMLAALEGDEEHRPSAWQFERSDPDATDTHCILDLDAASPPLSVTLPLPYLPDADCGQLRARAAEAIRAVVAAVRGLGRVGDDAMPGMDPDRSGPEDPATLGGPRMPWLLAAAALGSRHGTPDTISLPTPWSPLQVLGDDGTPSATGTTLLTDDERAVFTAHAPSAICTLTRELDAPGSAIVDVHVGPVTVFAGPGRGSIDIHADPMATLRAVAAAGAVGAILPSPPGLGDPA